MSRAWDKKKNLSPRQESNPRSSVNQSDALTTELSYFLSELKIHHLSLFTIPQGSFDIADPSSMQALKRPTGVRKVMDSIPSGTHIFSVPTLATF